MRLCDERGAVAARISPAFRLYPAHVAYPSKNQGGQEQAGLGRKAQGNDLRPRFCGPFTPQPFLQAGRWTLAFAVHQLPNHGHRGVKIIQAIVNSIQPIVLDFIALIVPKASQNIRKVIASERELSTGEKRRVLGMMSVIVYSFECSRAPSTPHCALPRFNRDIQ